MLTRLVLHEEDIFYCDLTPGHIELVNPKTVRVKVLEDETFTDIVRIYR